MRAPLLSCLALAVSACAGLQQLPDQQPDDATAIAALDTSADAAIKEIYASTDPASQKTIRNRFIERRLAVIDANYRAFVRDLAKENANADFAVAVAGIGAGGAGALVGETASQIFSAISGGLSGTQAAYGKAVLYEKTLSALVAQMSAGRAEIAARILERWKSGIADYPLWMAIQDLDAYRFAGSIPGAIVGTAGDAKEKEDAAVARISLSALPAGAGTQAMVDSRSALQATVDRLSANGVDAALARAATAFPELKPIADAQYGAAVRAGDTDRSQGKLLLKRLIVLSASDSISVAKWRQVLGS